MSHGNKLIQFKEAFELLRLWDKKVAKRVAEKLKNEYKKKVHYLLCIGAPNDQDGDLVTKREEGEISSDSSGTDTEDDDDKSKSSKSAAVHRQYRHAKKDIKEKKLRVLNEIDKRINEELIYCPVFLPPKGMTKAECVNRIKEALKEAEDKSATHFLIYYVGHGNKTKGAWVMNSSTKKRDGNGVYAPNECLIEIKEVLNLIK